MKAGEQNHNYIRNKKNRIRIYDEEREVSLKKTAERKEQNESKYGKVKYANLILIGEADRLAGNPLQDTGDKEKQIPYTYGYIEKASRVLEGHFASGRYDEPVQRKFGMLDFIHKIPERHIKNLKKYPAYLEGRVYQMGQVAYDYCTEHNLDVEEYIQTMRLFYSEVDLPTFKEGYAAREAEINKNSHKHK